MVITNVNQVVYQGDGVTTAWPFTFQIIDSTDIKLTLINAAGARTDITSDYYVDMVNNTVYYPGYAPGAEPPEANQPPKVQTGEKLEIYRRVPVNQLANLGKKWPFDVIEKGLDKLTMIIQDIYSWIGRNIVGLTEDGTSWDARNLPISNVGGPVSIEDAATKDYVDRILSGIIASGDGRIVPFDNVAQLIDADVVAGQIACTLGYYDINDGGAGVYNIRAKTPYDVDDGGSIIFLDNGDVAELITDETVSVKQFGAVGDGTNDDTVPLQNACKFAEKVVFPSGTYKITDYIPVYSNVLEADNAEINVAYSEWIRYVFRFYSDDYIKVSGLSVAVNHLAATGFEINKNDNANILDHVEIKNCKVTDTDNDISQLTSAGVFLYRQHHNSVIKNCVIDGVYRQSSNPGVIHSCGIQVTYIDGIGEISNNVISNVYMNTGDDTDADGIAVYSYNSFTDEKDHSSVTISNNQINNCQGRWIKSQASVLTVANNVCKNKDIPLILNYAGIDLQTGVGNVTGNSMLLFGVTGGTSGKFITLNATNSVSANPYCEVIGNKMYSDNSFTYGIIAIINHDLSTTFTITNNDFYNVKTGLYLNSTGTANKVAYVIIGNNIVKGTSYYYNYSVSALTDYIRLLDTGSIGDVVQGFGTFEYSGSNDGGMKLYLTELVESIKTEGMFVGTAIISGSGHYPAIVKRRKTGNGRAILHFSSKIYVLDYTNSATQTLYVYKADSTS